MAASDDHIAKLGLRLQEALAAPELQDFHGFAPGATAGEMIATLGGAFDAYVHHSTVQEVAFRRYQSVEAECLRRLPLITGYPMVHGPYHVGIDRHGEIHIGLTAEQLRRSMGEADGADDPVFAKLLRRVMGGRRPGRDG